MSCTKSIRVEEELRFDTAEISNLPTIEFSDTFKKPELKYGNRQIAELFEKYKPGRYIGKAKAEYIVDANGRTSNIIISNEDELHSAVVKAVRMIIGDMIYNPGKDENGNYVNVRMKQNFNIKEDVDSETGTEENLEKVLTRPAPIGEKGIDDFVNKAFDIYDSTKSASQKIRNIDRIIQESFQLQNFVGNPLAMPKREAKKIEKNMQSMKTQSEELIAMSKELLNEAKKLKFTKVASASRNITGSINALKTSLEVMGNLIVDLPEIITKIANFESSNNIVSSDSDFAEDSGHSGNSFTGGTRNVSGASGSSVLSINESELQTLIPSFGQIVFTKDTKKLLFFDGTNFKKIILEDL